MSGSPKDVTVRVFLHPTEDPPFHLETDLPTGKDDELQFVNDHHPGFRVRFELQEPTHGYAFPPNSRKDDAVWSKLGAGECPKSPRWDVFKVSHVDEPDCKAVIVKNANFGSVLGKFGYTLRVSNAAGKTLYLDPGGDNMNGPISRNFEWSAVLIGVGSAITTSLVLITGAYLAGFELVMR